MPVAGMAPATSAPAVFISSGEERDVEELGHHLVLVRGVGDAGDGNAAHVADLGVEVDGVGALRQVLADHLDAGQPVAEQARPHQLLERRAERPLRLEDGQERPVELGLVDRQLRAAELEDAAAEVGEPVGLGERPGAGEVGVGEVLEAVADVDRPRWPCTRSVRKNPKPSVNQWNIRPRPTRPFGSGKPGQQGEAARSRWPTRPPPRSRPARGWSCRRARSTVTPVARRAVEVDLGHERLGPDLDPAGEQRPPQRCRARRPRAWIGQPCPLQNPQFTHAGRPSYGWELMAIGSGYGCQPRRAAASA